MKERPPDSWLKIRGAFVEADLQIFQTAGAGTAKDPPATGKAEDIQNEEGQGDKAAQQSACFFK